MSLHVLGLGGWAQRTTAPGATVGPMQDAWLRSKRDERLLLM